mgnify:FL=1|jgi:hypothetical protein
MTMEKCKECEYCMRCTGELTCTDGYNENYDHHINTITECERYWQPINSVRTIGPKDGMIETSPIDDFGATYIS